MKSKDGFVQAYNAQAAVDAEAQIIVAQDVTQSAVDCGQLVPMIDAIEANLGRNPAQLSADAGYCSEANLAALEARDIDGYVATGRARDAVAGTAEGEAAAAPSSTQPAKTPTRVEAMRTKIKDGGHESPYRLRKQLPEPVFGQIKQARGFRQFLMRGFDKARAEWAIVCTAHNPPKKIGAPTTYTEEMADRICTWVEEGKSLYSFCQLEDTPYYQTINGWRDANPIFDARYTRAKHRGLDVMAEQTVDVSSVLDRPPEQAQAAKLAFDARRWYLSKVAPKVWGDKADVRQEVTGPGGGPLQVDVLVNMLLTPQNLERLSEAHVAAIREAALLLAAPAPPTIDAEAVPVEPTDTAGED